MVYTRWKCDRIFLYAPRYFIHDHPFVVGASFWFMSYAWRYFSYCSEETERKFSYWCGYPYWRDPIARRNEAKYKKIIRTNNIDVTDEKWTGGYDKVFIQGNN